MNIRHLAATAVLSAAVLAVPSAASADWLLTPFVGGVFGGSVDFGNSNFDDQVERQINVGASLGWMGAGIVGFEVDFGYTPNFFENTAGSGDFKFGDSNVTTVMGNVLVGAPIGGQHGPGLRPYASGGVGLISSHVQGVSGLFNDLDSNDFGMNVGAGVHGFFNDHVGLRGDVRYFRSFQDNNPGSGLDLGLSNFDFWRATAGVTFRFGS